jgi:acetyl-CoA carboxylase carboxyltransferase component
MGFTRQKAYSCQMKLTSPLAATVVYLAPSGTAFREGALLAIVEAMKMEHELRSDCEGVVGELQAAVGDVVEDRQTLLIYERNMTIPRRHLPENPQKSAFSSNSQAMQGIEAAATDEGADSSARAAQTAASHLTSGLRPDLQKVIARHAPTLDAARHEAINKRHALGMRSARENVAALVDAGSFVEYGALAVAAQATRRSMDDLVANTPADGMVTGIGSVAGARCVVMAYDATVLAGTQGMRNHQKTDRMLGIALAEKLPVLLFAEGGGGRPGDVDMPIVAGLHVATFASFARLNGQVPVVGIAAGRCFAGNAALLGCCDVVIATRQSNIGMGGPAMVEGGGIGVFKPEEIGPSSVQHANGVIDVLVDDEVQAVAAARKYLGFFTRQVLGDAPVESVDDEASSTVQSLNFEAAKRTAQNQSLRDIVPENRRRSYDSRVAIAALADAESVLALRTAFGAGIHTALARIAGRAVGIMANNPLHLGGAIDADAADKAARFMQLCNAHGLPIVSLIDTPGFMVGPEVEATAQVRHVSRLFIAAAHLRVPRMAVVLRKAYGLGAMAMAAGSLHAPQFTIAWPTAEFGAMGLEGAVKLGYKKELAAQPTQIAREALYEELVAKQYAAGSAINMAQTLEIDAVIDPADTRRWIAQALRDAPVLGCVGLRIDTW